VGNGDALYLDLMKKVLTGMIYEDPPQQAAWYFFGEQYRQHQRANGEDWPTVAHTMIGLKRLDNLQSSVERLIADDVRGDFIETGVWRGGACIFMRALLLTYGVRDRKVWVADSFQGMPVTDKDSYPGDRELALHKYNDALAVSLERVKANFTAYGLLDDQVEFLPGWFRDSLPDAPIKEIALLRLDSDLFESTMDTLVNLYPKVSVGGYVVIDDYVIPACREAVHRFRDAEHIEDELVTIDESSVYWRRSA